MATTTSIGPIDVGGIKVIPANSAIPLDEGSVITWNLTGENTETDFVNVQTAGLPGGFNWYNTPSGVAIDPRIDTIMYLDGDGNLQPAGLTSKRFNTYLYVGERVFPTIQAAVDYAQEILEGTATVVVLMEHPASDHIANVVNGSIGTYIIDERNSSQLFYWSGSAYSPADFVQEGAIVISRQNAKVGLFPAFPTATLPVDDPGVWMGWNALDNGEADFINVAPAGEPAGFTWFQTPQGVALNPGDELMHLDAAGSLTVGVLGVLRNSYEGLTTDATGGAYIAWNLSNLGAEMDFVCDHGTGGGGGFNWYNVPADTLVDDTTTPLMTLDESGVLTLKRGGVVLPADPTAPMEAATKQYVDTHGGGGGGGMVYPGAGVPQSTGAAWGASIPAANLARTNAANVFAAAQTFQGTVTLSADPTTNLQAATKEYVDNHSSMIYPGAGVPQSDGAAWGASIPAANLAYRNQANTFTAAQTFNSTVTLSADPTANLQAATKQYVDNKAAVYPGAGVAVSTGSAWGAPIAPATLPRLDVFNVFTAAENFTLGFVVGNKGLALNPDNGGGYGILTFNGSAAADYLGIAGTGVSGDHALYFSAPGPTGAYAFAVNGINVLEIHSTGVAVTGDFTVSGTKGFRVPYPITKDTSDPSMTLTHACLEGPENGVIYRGVVETSAGVALVTLPEYFEALTMDENRSVLLTQMYDEDEAEPAFAMLMASQVREAQFTIRSSTPIAKVAWEVKAVRADQPPLQVVGEYVPPPSMDAGKQTEPTPQPQPRRRR